MTDQKKKTAVVVFDEFQEIANFEDDEIDQAYLLALNMYYANGVTLSA